jgi:hypothetical protein
MKTTLVEVVNKPVNFKGEPYGVGSVIDCGSSNEFGAMLSGGCVPVKTGTPTKKVSTKAKATTKTDPKADK